MTSELAREDLPGEWLESALLGKEYRNIYFCKISVPNGKVLYGYLEAKSNNILIPMQQRDMLPEDSGRSVFLDGDEVLRRQRQLFEYFASRRNSGQFLNKQSAVEVYRELGTQFTFTYDEPPVPEVETSTISSGFGWCLYLRNRNHYSEKDSLLEVIQNIGTGLNWKIEPVSKQELDQILQPK